MTSQHVDIDPLRPDHCVAVRSQIEVYDWEDDLYALARIKHRTCVWWWGARMAGPRFGAKCYICDVQITTWARNYPMTTKAKLAVEGHKMFHRAQTIPSPHAAR